MNPPDSVLTSSRLLVSVKKTKLEHYQEDSCKFYKIRAKLVIFIHDTSA